MAKAGSKVPSALSVFNEFDYRSWRAATVLAGCELGVFDLIASGKTSVPEIAVDAGADEVAMRRLLDTLVALGHLTRKVDKYGLTPPVATYLVKSSELYMDGAATIARRNIEMWSHLAETVKAGRPVGSRPSQDELAQFFSTLVRAIFPMGFMGSKSAVAAIDKKVRGRISAILDVAAGACAWSIPFAQAIPKARVTVVDFPGVANVAREYTGRFGVGDRYEYIEGDLRETDFGRERFDLVILGHIIHGEGREHGRKLIERSFAALKDKGMLLIAEFIPNDDRTGPELPMLFGLNMLLARGKDGDVFTMREYREWLKGAGFKGVKTIRSPNQPSPMILARK
jgi:3-hydroxy-5-methyl-1-naphthoate 3-O-methyltransferase